MKSHAIEIPIGNATAASPRALSELRNTMQPLALGAFVTMACLNLAAQPAGIVTFGNNNSCRVTNGVTGQPVTAAEGVKAALYWSVSGANSFVQIGPAVDVGVPLDGLFTGGERVATNAANGSFTPGGTNGDFRVRVWSGGASTFEQAQSTGTNLLGQSAVMAVVTGNPDGAPPLPPPLLTANGLQGFTLNGGVQATPCIAVVKLCNYPPFSPTCFPAGANINFIGYVTNCGDIRLTNVTIVDSRPLLGAGLLDTNGFPLIQPLTLEAGQAIGFRGSFAPSLAEICAGSAANTITVRGTDVSALAASVTNSTATTCAICVNPCLTVTTTCNNVPLDQANTVSGAVTNCGNLTITNIVISDNQYGTLATIPSLAPGAFETYSRLVTNATCGNFTNIVTANGRTVCGQPVTAQASGVCVVTVNPCIGVTKYCDTVTLGQANLVTAVVTNCGDTSLIDITITDTLYGSVGTVASLAPGGSATLTKLVTNSVCGEFTNTVTASGTSVCGASGLSVLLNEDFNAGDGGFTVNTPVPYDGPWVYSAPTGSWTEAGQGPDNGHPNTSTLISPAITVPQAGAVGLTFTHRYSFEQGNWDGGQVRVSVNGGAFTAVPAGAFTQNGYNGAVVPNSTSDLHGQSAFVLDSPNFVTSKLTSVCSLGSFQAGDLLRVAFMAANDWNTRGNFQPNWEIDSVTVATAGQGVPVQATSTAICTVRCLPPPTITCPSNVVAECTGGLTPVTYTVTAVDASGAPVPVVCVPPSGSGFRLGTTNVACTATDTNSQSSSCTFPVFVIDTTPPQVNCPTNITVQASNCSGAVVTYSASASDACGLASFSCVPPSGTLFPSGTTTVTCIAIDAATNRAACSFQVKVLGIPPTITCPGDIVATNDPGQCSAVVNYTVTATNNCGGCTPLAEDFNTSPGGFTTLASPPPSWTYNGPGGSWVVGESTATLAAQAVGPTLQSPPILVTCAGIGQLTLVHRFTFPQGPWGGGSVQFSTNGPGGPFIPVLPVVTNVNVGAPAAAPPEPPFVTNVANLGPLNPGNLVVLQFIANGDTGLNVGGVYGVNGLIQWEITSVALAVGGGGGPVTVVCNPPSGSVFPVGTNTVCCVATDAAGNTNSCCFDVTVLDQEPPKVECNGGVNPSGKKIPVAGKNPASGQNPDGYYQLLGKDNCDSDPLIYIADTGSSFVAGPFHNGDVIKLTQSPGKTPSQDPAPAPIVAHLHFKGDGLLYAVDASGNQSEGVLCLVPRPPK